EAMGDDAAALADCRRVLELAPDDLDGRLTLARVLARTGQAPEAAAHYEWLRARPNPPPGVVLGLARCRLDLHELDEAGRLLDGLLAERPDHVAARVARGRLALRRGREAEAEPDLR